MLVSSFRFPYADTYTPSEKLLNRARAVLDEADVDKNPQISTAQLLAVHPYVNDLKHSLDVARMHIDAIGHNEGNKPDHVILGYEAAKKAAERQPDGSQRLSDFTSASQHASLERNVQALNFLDESVIKPHADESSAEILKTLERLESMLAPMPCKDIADRVFASKAELNKADSLYQASREYYEKVRTDPTSDSTVFKNALRDVSEKRTMMKKMEAEHQKYIMLPEVGETRATEIIATFPISETRALLTQIVRLRAQVLRMRALPYFFDAVHVERVIGQNGARNERELLVAEALRERGNMTPSQIQDELIFLRHQEIHGQHNERVLDHVANTADMTTEILTASTQAQLADLDVSLTHRSQHLANQVVGHVNTHTSLTAIKTVTLINNHTDLRMREVVQTMIDQANELGQFIKEIQHDTAHRQVHELHAMIQDAVQSIGQNTESSLASVKSRMGLILNKHNELASQQQKLLTSSQTETSAEHRSRMLKDTGNTLKVMSYAGKLIEMFFGAPW